MKNIQWHAKCHCINIYKQKIMGLTAVLIQLLKKKNKLEKMKHDIRTCSLFDLIFLHIHETIKVFITTLSPITMSAGPAVREVTQKEHWTYPEGFGLASGEPDVRRVRHANMRPGFPYPHFTSQSL